MLLADATHRRAGSRPDPTYTDGKVNDMRRVMTLLCVAILATSTQAITAHSAGLKICTADRYEVDSTMGTAKQHAHVRALIRCAVRRWPVAGGASFAISVADCESSLNYDTKSASGYLGLYQFQSWSVHPWLRREWFTRWTNHGPSGKPGWKNERANVFRAIRWASQLGWDPWEQGACA